MKTYLLRILTAVIISLIAVPLIDAQTIWEKDQFKVEMLNKNILISSNGKQLVDIASINFNFTQPKSIEVAGKTSDKLSLKLTYPSTASYRTVATDVVADVEITAVNNGIRIFSNPDWARNITIQMKDNGEHYFGISEQLYPNNIKAPDLRGDVIDVDVLGDDNQFHENYSSAWSAFYMTDKGYASFFDTFAKGRYQFAINGVTELYHHTGKLDWYLFTGNNGDKILQAYYDIIGKPKFVPLWACGPVAWRDQNNGGKDEILADIEHMTELKIPFTGWFVDRPYSNGADEWSKMDFNNKFSDPGTWIKTINEKYGMQFMTWVGPMTFADKDFTGLLPNFKGYIDLTNPKAVKEFGERLKKNQYAYNVRGHKMDRADEQFPEMSNWYDGTPEPERRNKYIYLYSKYINKFLTESFGEDQFNFARAAYQRCQPNLSALWGGDSRSTWDGMAGNLANAMRCGFIGFPVWGSDVGGYLGGRISEKLYARWLEFGSWSGLFEVKLDNAGGKGEDRPPWKYSERLQNIFRNACDWRMQILPYVYSYANTSHKNGVMMKPLAYAFPEDENTFNVWNEYLFGDAFLVAPIVDSTDAREIYLPEGEWINFNNLGEVLKGGQTIKVDMPLDKIPVYIKRNSIYVTGSLLKGNSKNWIKSGNENLSVHIYPGDKGEQFTFSYVDYNDGNKEKSFEVRNEDGKILISLEAIKINCKTEIFSAKKPVALELNGHVVKYGWDKEKNIITIKLAAGKENKIEIRY